MDIPNNLLPSRLRQGAGSAHGEYVIFAAPGTTPAMVADPGYWLHLGNRLRVQDRISVIAEDGSFDMDIRVADVDPRGLYARVRVLRLCDGAGVAVPGAEPAKPPVPTQAGTPDRDGYIREQTPKGWRVLRGSDLIVDGLPGEAAAVAAIEDARAGKPARKTA